MQPEFPAPSRRCTARRPLQGTDSALRGRVERCTMRIATRVSAPDRSNMKVLVVEDQREIGTLLRQGLAEAGYVVGCAATCAAASDALCENSYDAIVLDL